MVVTNQSQVSQLLMGYHTDHNCFPRCRISAFIRISQNHLNLLLQPAISNYSFYISVPFKALEFGKT